MGKEKSDIQNKDESNEIIENNNSNLENNSNNSDLDSNNVLNDADKEKAFDIFYKSLEKSDEEEIFEEIQKCFNITFAQVEELNKKENWADKADKKAEEYLTDINKDADKKQLFDAFYDFRKTNDRDDAIQKTAEKGDIDLKILTDWDDNENWEKLRKQQQIHINAMREFIVFKLDTPKKKFSLEESVNQIAKEFNITSAEVHRWYVDENWNDECSKWEDMKKTLKKFELDELKRFLSDNNIGFTGKKNKKNIINQIIKQLDYEKINLYIKNNNPTFLKGEIKKLTSQIKTLESENNDLVLENEKLKNKEVELNSQVKILKDKGEEFDSLKNTLADIIFYIWSIGEYVPKDSAEFNDYKMQINEIKEIVEHEGEEDSVCELKNQIEFLDNILNSFKNMHYKYKRFNNSLTKNKIIIQDDFLNKKYEPNMDLKVVSHSEDLNFDEGAISKVIKPSIFYNNKKIHKGAIIVNKNSTEENEDIEKNITPNDAVEIINKSENKLNF